VGETGLDYNRMFSPMAQQLEAFSAQVGVQERSCICLINFNCTVVVSASVGLISMPHLGLYVRDVQVRKLIW